MFSYDNQVRKDDCMKIIIMNGNRGTWYSGKVGKVYKVQEIRDKAYITKDGLINKEDAEIIEK